MNDFQKNLLKKYPQFQPDDFSYFVDTTAEKVKALSLPTTDCCINDTFIDAVEEDFLRLQYCFKNCGFKCLQGLEYKKISK